MTDSVLFTELADLAAERLGGSVLLANDEFFAPKEALVKASAPEWREGLYTERGKWMDGWETRRRRTPGYDWCVVRLGAPGVVRGVVVDTTWFTGNYPESCSIEGAELAGLPDLAALAEGGAVQWQPVLPQTVLAGNVPNVFAVTGSQRVTHVRLNIFPDGGVARLRVHGNVVAGAEILKPGSELDLAAMAHGGWVVVCSDMFYGHRQNLIMPGSSTHMGDGWETKRRRGPGNDWTIVQLAVRGTITRLELDTDHFKGNAPGSCSLEWCDARGAVAEALTSTVRWQPLVSVTPLQPDARHAWAAPSGATATHVRLNIFPDGGVARLRVFGMLATPT